jgi:hypothetical protein
MSSCWLGGLDSACSWDGIGAALVVGAKNEMIAMYFILEMIAKGGERDCNLYKFVLRLFLLEYG